MTFRVSASQIDNFRRCKRKWALEKIDGVSSPPNEYAQHGQQVHSVLEAWSNYGTSLPDDSVGATAMPALRHIPEPGRSDVDNEIFFDFPLPNVDAIVRGYIDQICWGEEGQPVVRDFKTTGNLGYAHTEHSLIQDTQATLYTYAALKHLFPGVDFVDLEWLYLQRVRDAHTQGRAHPVRLRVCESTLADMPFNDIEDTVQEMIEAWEEYGDDAMQASPDFTACDMFGGCPHVEICKPTNQNRLRSFMAQNDLLDKVKKKKKDNVNPPEPEPESESEPETKPEPRSKSKSEPEAKPEKLPSEENLSRDAFAESALAGLAANPANQSKGTDELAFEAFALADAAMKARQK